jgi:integrase
MDEAQEFSNLCIQNNGSGVPCYVFRYWEIHPDGRRERKKKEVGKVNSMTREQAEEIVAPWRRALEAHRGGPVVVETMGHLIDHFRFYELSEGLDRDGEAEEHNSHDDDFDPDGRAWSTQSRYEYVLKAWIEPRWANVRLKDFIAGEVEQWLHGLKKKPHRKRKAPFPEVDPKKLKPLSAGSKFKIRSLMSVLFNHGIRWGLFPYNPISGPTRKAGVRQSSKRQKAPDILELTEMRLILPELAVRELALVSLDMITGIRRGELAGLKWKDIDFGHLVINVIRSVVDQRTGKCKTEASAKPVPIDEYTAEDLLAWYRLTPYRDPEDWVFASDDPRLGDKRGKQPLWLAKIMQYHIQPLVKRLGITKRVSWQTFRSTFSTLLTANKENVKVVQELLRHASSKITMDVYAQAQMEDKRRAQLRIVRGLRRPEAEKKRGIQRTKKPLQQVGRKMA